MTHDPRLLDRPQSDSDLFSREELDNAGRNHGLHLELLALDTTPIGSHYVVLHFDVPVVDGTEWRLEVGGLVERPLALGLPALRERQRATVPVTLECAGNGRALMTPRPATMPWFVEGVSTAAWGGVSLQALLEEAGVDTRRGRAVVFRGRDRGRTKGIAHHYERALPLEQALRPEALLAFEMNGQPLPPAHGFPLRLVVPGWYGMASVKWLDRITVIDHDFEGYHQRYVYRDTQCAEEPGQAVTRMNVRSLFAPPGVPDGDTRARSAEPGTYLLAGKAWSGAGAVARVEFSSDGGRSWQDATLLPPASPHAWQPWTARWEATPGRHVLCSRATDVAGRTQPMEPRWNLQGMGNNSVYLVEVAVGPPRDHPAPSPHLREPGS
jgi:DMSO/TMAO reductase YedYZ molybdopterin-dependent catalytic subunit